MRHLILPLILVFFCWSCSDNNPGPQPDPIPTPDIDVGDTESVEGAFLEANPGWEKKDGDLPASSGSRYISIAQYGPLNCFNGRETSIGFNDYDSDPATGFYVKIVGSDSYFVVQSDENLRVGRDTERAQRLIKGNPLVIEPRDPAEANNQHFQELYFFKAIVPASIKPGMMELEIKAFFSNGDVSDSRPGQLEIFQLGGGSNSNGYLITRNWNIKKLEYSERYFGPREIIFGSEQSLLSLLPAQCKDGSIENILVDIVYTYVGGSNISAKGSYRSVLTLKARTADFNAPNWDCGDPIIYTDIEEIIEDNGGWGMSEDGTQIITILDPYFDENGYYYSQRTVYSKIMDSSPGRLVLREYEVYDPAYYVDITMEH